MQKKTDKCLNVEKDPNIIKTFGSLASFIKCSCMVYCRTLGVLNFRDNNAKFYKYGQ